MPLQPESRDFFKVQPDSPIMAVIEAAIERRRAFNLAIEAAKAKYGATGVWITGSWGERVTGFSFESLPEGWRQTRRGVCVPIKKTAAGRLIAKEIADLPRGVDACTFSGMLFAATGKAYTYQEDCRFFWSSFDRVGDTYILSVPSGCKADPPGCQKLKLSEYWQLKEAEADAAEQRKENI